MKISTLFSITAIASAATTAMAQDAPAPSVTPEGIENPSTILFIGNSYLYYGDSIHNHVIRMARDAYPDGDFTYKSATISGAYLDQQAVESHLEPGKLGVEEGFDIVILQGHSSATTSPEKLERFNAAVESIDELVDAAEAQTALYMTPAYTEVHEQNDPEMFSGIDQGYTEAGNSAEALVIPVGLAFEMAYEQAPEIVLHKDFDGSHPSSLGTYLAAATVYAALYDKSVEGNGYDYYGTVSAEDATFLQRIAEEAVTAYYSR